MIRPKGLPDCDCGPWTKIKMEIAALRSLLARKVDKDWPNDEGKILKIVNGEVAPADVDIPDIDVDDELSLDSENPVQNKIITASVNSLGDGLEQVADGLDTAEDDIDALETAMAGKADTADLAPVATSGDYYDLDNLPNIPSRYRIQENFNKVIASADPVIIPITGAALGFASTPSSGVTIPTSTIVTDTMDSTVLPFGRLMVGDSLNQEITNQLSISTASGISFNPLYARDTSSESLPTALTEVIPDSNARAALERLLGLMGYDPTTLMAWDYQDLYLIPAGCYVEGDSPVTVKGRLEYDQNNDEYKIVFENAVDVEDLFSVTVYGNGYYTGTDMGQIYIVIPDGDSLEGMMDSVSVPTILDQVEGKPDMLTGTAAPTTATEGDVGDFYLNTTDNKLYQCKAENAGSYTWEEIGAGGSTEGKLIFSSTSYSYVSTLTAPDGTTISTSDLNMAINNGDYNAWDVVIRLGVGNQYRDTYYYPCAPSKIGNPAYYYWYAIKNHSFEMVRLGSSVTPTLYTALTSADMLSNYGTRITAGTYSQGHIFTIQGINDVPGVTIWGCPDTVWEKIVNGDLEVTNLSGYSFSMVVKATSVTFDSTPAFTITGFRNSAKPYNILTPQETKFVAPFKRDTSNIDIDAATAPSNPKVGQFWYDTANSQLKFYDGTAWEEVGGGSGGEKYVITYVDSTHATVNGVSYTASDLHTAIANGTIPFKDTLMLNSTGVNIAYPNDISGGNYRWSSRYNLYYWDFMLSATTLSNTGGYLLSESTVYKGTYNLTGGTYAAGAQIASIYTGNGITLATLTQPIYDLVVSNDIIITHTGVTMNLTAGTNGVTVPSNQLCFCATLRNQSEGNSVIITRGNSSVNILTPS